MSYDFDRVEQIGILSPGKMKARLLAIARGDLRPHPSDPKLWASSHEALDEILANPNHALYAQYSEAIDASGN